MPASAPAPEVRWSHVWLQAGQQFSPRLAKAIGRHTASQPGHGERGNLHKPSCHRDLQAGCVAQDWAPKVVADWQSRNGIDVNYLLAIRLPTSPAIYLPPILPLALPSSCYLPPLLLFLPRQTFRYSRTWIRIFRHHLPRHEEL